ncbi:hypothetical protein ElyMa_002473700 [Elysia marginata]|uniref:Uncharacterized protein n=1 Tax=Elysia marginata TaxID=1093978 RepID=A0AAV4GLU7_9GAST|nr:hypothetical protein ElyMa_002473700 [Elysia marginata]
MFKICISYKTARTIEYLGNLQQLHRLADQTLGNSSRTGKYQQLHTPDGGSIGGDDSCYNLRSYHKWPEENNSYVFFLSGDLPVQPVTMGDFPCLQLNHKLRLALHQKTNQISCLQPRSTEQRPAELNHGKLSERATHQLK